MDRRRIALAELDRLQKISTAGCSAESAMEISEEIRLKIAIINPIREMMQSLAGGTFDVVMTERRELLAWIVSEAIEPGEHQTEKQVNERLLSYTDDVVMLRRYMIDFGLLERTASGSSYSRQA
jgi:hypothetical protein